jgi:hypothetical protein
MRLRESRASGNLDRGMTVSNGWGMCALYPPGTKPNPAVPDLRESGIWS